ncbi:MAG: hypothetical protein ACI8P9_002658 [Parasphingorhabdus sp.]|jgi:hypothetical protein
MPVAERLLLGLVELQFSHNNCLLNNIQKAVFIASSFVGHVTGSGQIWDLVEKLAEAIWIS